MIYVEAARIQELNPSLDTRAILGQIKDSHPDIDEEAFKFFYGGEKQRKDVEMIYVEAARIQELNPSLDTRAILGQIKDSHPDIEKGSLAVAKQGLDVKTIHVEAARIQELNPSLDTRAIGEQIKDNHPDIKKGSFAAAKQSLDVKTIHVEAARIQELNPSLDTSAICEQIEANHPDIKKGSFAVAKQGLDVKTIHVEAARIQELNPSLDTRAICEQIKASHPDIKKGSLNFVFLNFNNIVKKRKNNLTHLINSAEKTAKEEGKNVEDIMFTVYECTECAKTRETEYTGEYHIITRTDVRNNICLLCGKGRGKRYGFRSIGNMEYAEVVALRRKLDEESGKKRKKKPRSRKRKGPNTEVLAPFAGDIKEPPVKRQTTSSISKLIGRAEEVEFTGEDFTLALEALKQPATPGPSRYLESPDMTFAVTPVRIFSLAERHPNSKPSAARQLLA